MFLLENIQLALEGLKTNKMRALLTMLGIIIGIGSVIAIVTVGDSMTASVSTSMQSLGATNIMVMLQRKDSDSMRGSQMAGGNISAEDLISDEMIENYLRRYERSITAIGLSGSGGSAKAQDNRLYANVTITGANEGYSLVNNINVIEGRFLREGDIKSNRYVAVVSDKLVKNMFRANESPLGKEIKINSDNSMQTYTIVGVYKHEDSISMGPMGGASSSEKDIRTNLYIPITTCKIINSMEAGYQSITVMAGADTDSRKFTNDTRNFFNTYYANNARYEINAISMEAMMSTMTSMLGTLSIAVAVIAGISLLVGGVGVMNIMLVSVTERTREIGTRKALGARNSAIRAQFIVEAVIICAIGGLIGILTGVGLGYIGSVLLGSPGLPSIFIIVVAVLFSMVIGVFFGYYPANKASKLDPIEALRYE
ncbi:MAG: ABC transporter permease [Treponema sp.]|nr:ABC transporter permease [Treponema sp.]